MSGLKQFIRKKSFFLAPLSALLFVAACQQAPDGMIGELNNLDPVYPDVGEVVTSANNVFQMRVSPDLKDELVVVLNGKEFVVAETEFIHTTRDKVYGNMYDFRGALVLGENSLGIRTNKVGSYEAYNFFFDDHNPRLHITNVFKKPVEAVPSQENPDYTEADRAVEPTRGDTYIVEGEFVDPSAIEIFSLSDTPLETEYFTVNDDGSLKAATTLAEASHFRLTMLGFGVSQTISYTLMDELLQETNETLLFPGNASGAFAAVQMNSMFTDNARPLVDELIKGIWNVSVDNKIINVPNPVTVKKLNSSQAAVAGVDMISIESTPGLGIEGGLACPSLGDFKVVPVNGKAPAGCGIIIADTPILTSPTVSFGFWKHDSDNAMQAYFDIRLAEVAFDIEMFTYTDLREGLKLLGNGQYVRVPVGTYGGGYKTRVVLRDVTLRSFMDLSATSTQFIGMGSPGTFTLRYTDDVTQILANILTGKNIIPQLENVSCNICKNGEVDILNFIIDFGFASRSDAGDNLIGKAEEGMSEIIKPVIETIIQSIPMIYDPVKLADNGLNTRYYDKNHVALNITDEGNAIVDASGEPVAPQELHMKQTIYTNYIDTVAERIIVGPYTAKLQFSGGFTAAGTGAKKTGLGSFYQNAIENRKVNSSSWAGGKDSTVALSSTGINQYLFAEHQLGFLGQEGMSFTMKTDLLDLVSGNLNLDDFYSYMFKGSDLLYVEADEASNSNVELLEHGNEVKVEFITHQAPQIELFGETPGRNGIHLNVQGIDFPNFGGKEQIPGAVKMISPDVQVIVSKPDSNNVGKFIKLLDFHIDLELDAFIGVEHGLPYLIPRDEFSKVRVTQVDYYPYPDVSELTQRAILAFAMAKALDDTLVREVDGDINQLNLLLRDAMRKLSRIEDVKHASYTPASETEVASCGKLKLDLLPVDLNYQSLLSHMAGKAVLHKPVFRWLTVDETGGWLMMGIDLQTSRPNVCPQFLSGLNGVIYDPAGPLLAPPNHDEAAPLSLCIHSALVAYEEEKCIID